MELQARSEPTSKAEKAWLIQNLFGISLNDNDQYRSIDSYCNYLEGSFDKLLGGDFAGIWPVINCPYPKHGSDCWPWLIAVLKVAKEQNDDSSIEDIWKHLVLQTCHDVGGQDQSRKDHEFVAIFAVLCWVTMTLNPVLHFNKTPSSIYLDCHIPNSKSERHRQKLDQCRRPIGAVFRNFKPHAWDTGTRYNIEDRNLYEASLNYYSLHEFGKIRIGWVDTISDHLKFSPASRVLSLFRFPTFCVLRAIQCDEPCPILDRFVVAPTTLDCSLTGDCRIVQEFDPLISGGRSDSYITLDQEVLLSYRVLFGKSTRSRDLARRELDKLKRDARLFDNLLTALCSQRYRQKLLFWSNSDNVLKNLPKSVWPISCCDSDGNLLESDVYSIENDFPRLGYRLLALQSFNLRQRPSRLTDLWRDRRNPMQWYTFWAVLLVGSVGLILALLQLIAGVLQVIRTW